MTNKIYMAFEKSLRELPLDGTELIKRTDRRKLTEKAFLKDKQIYVYNSQSLAPKEENFVLYNMLELCIRALEYVVNPDEMYKFNNAINAVFNKTNLELGNGNIKSANRVLKTGIKTMTTAHEKYMQPQTNRKGR